MNNYDNFFKQAKKARIEKEEWQDHFDHTNPSDQTNTELKQVLKARRSNRLHTQPNEDKKILKKNSKINFALRDLEIDHHFNSPVQEKVRAKSENVDLAHLTPEQRLKLRLLQKKREMRQKQREKSSAPVYAIFGLICVLTSLGLGIYFSDQFDGQVTQTIQEWLNKVQIKLNLASAADEAPKAQAEKTKKEEKSADKGAKKEEKKSEASAQSSENKKLDVRNMSAEELNSLSHLADRKRELDQREEELNKLDEELQKQRVELDTKIQKLEKMRAEISGVLKQKVEVDQEKVDKLVQFYSTMKAQQAAKVIETLNEDLAVEVLDKMKKKNAAEILNSLDSKKAKRLSEMLAGYRKPAAEEESKK